MMPVLLLGFKFCSDGCYFSSCLVPVLAWESSPDAQAVSGSSHEKCGRLMGTVASERSPKKSSTIDQILSFLLET